MSIHAIAKQRRTSSCATTSGVEKHVASPFPSEQPCAHADTSQPLQAVGKMNQSHCLSLNPASLPHPNWILLNAARLQTPTKSPPKGTPTSTPSAEVILQQLGGFLLTMLRLPSREVLQTLSKQLVFKTKGCRAPFDARLFQSSSQRRGAASGHCQESPNAGIH